MIRLAFMITRPRSRKDSAAQAGCDSRANATARATSSGMKEGRAPNFFSGGWIVTDDFSAW